MSLNSPFRLPWTESFIRAFLDWFPWMLLSPLVLWLASRFPLGGARWGRRLMIHLGACVVIAIAYQVIAHYARPQPKVYSFNTGAAPFASTSALQVVSFNPTNLGPVTFQGMQPVRAAQGVHVSAVGSGVLRPAVLSTNFTFTAAKPIGGWRWMILSGAVARSQFTIPVYWGMVGVCWAVAYYRESRERERKALELESRLTQANLQTLKMQLQPHFLFNTLNAISTLVHKNPKAADDMIVSLSEFLRMSLEASLHHDVPLRAELEFLDHYLSIQQIRFGDRLQIFKEIDSDVLHAKVPALLLQPLVENAVRHAIEPRENSGAIFIRVTRQSSRLCIEISDNGDGSAATGALVIKEGVGLSNTKARLQEMYGEAHQFSLARNESGGVTARITLPFPTLFTTPTTHALL